MYVPSRDAGKKSSWRSSPVRTPEEISVDSARRAKGRMRRQIRKNRGRFLWTFTYETAVYDYDQVVADVGSLLVNLRESEGHVWIILVAEPHPGGHGWHVHAATNRWIDHAAMHSYWGKGWVWVGDHAHKHKKWVTRELAGYLAKYAAKGLTDDRLFGCGARPPGAHRFWVTQGFEPQKVRKAFRLMRDAALWVLKHYGPWDHEVILGETMDVPVEGFWWEFPDKYLRRLPNDP